MLPFVTFRGNTEGSHDPKFISLKSKSKSILAKTIFFNNRNKTKIYLIQCY